MKKILFVNGCSMTYGLELKDDENGKCLDDIYREKTAWPGQLGEILGFDQVINVAVNSGSNDRVLRTTVKEIYKLLNSGETDISIFVAIGWSGAMRREFYIDGDWLQVVPYHDHKNQKLDRLNRVYREVAWHDIECAHRFLTEVLSLQSFLKLHNIPYVFFDAISPAKEQIINAGEEGLDYARNIDVARYMGIDDINGCMADMVRNEFPNWSGRHPSPEGHRWWAEKLANYIKENDLLNKDVDEKRIDAFRKEQRKRETVKYIYS